MGKGGNMGYRSTVAYTIRFTPIPSNNVDLATEEEIKECKESFYCFLAEAKVKFPSAISDSAITMDEKNFALNFFADDVKWYEDYEDVKCHMSLLQLAQSWVDDVDEKNGETKGNKHIGGIFVRVGENADDITEEAFGEHDWDWIGVRRQVYADWME
jgi:hypothetical protein